MIAQKLLSRVSRTGINRIRSLISQQELCQNPPYRGVPLPILYSIHHTFAWNTVPNGLRFWSSATPQPAEKEANHGTDEQEMVEEGMDTSEKVASNETKGSSISEPYTSETKSTRKRRRSTKRTAFSDSDLEEDLSFDDLVKLVAEKEELLKSKHKEIEKLQDKVLRSYADMENIMDRTKRESENSKKFAIQSFAKSLLDVADNLGRASSVVKESFSKIDQSQDTAGAVPLLKTLLEGVEMTNKQLTEVFKKFGVEKYDPINDLFDPNKHNAVFQVPDASKPAGTVAVVLKIGYMLHDRVLRPAEVGVTSAVNDDDATKESD